VILIFTLLSEYISMAAGWEIITGLVSSHQTFGEHASRHPHWHTIVLEGGFDRWDRFTFIPISAGDELVVSMREAVLGFLDGHHPCRRAQSRRHSIP
jgi:hypothetical protein